MILNYLKKRLGLESESQKLMYLYQLVLAMARIQMINPEILSDEASKSKENAEYADKVIVKSRKG